MLRFALLCAFVAYASAERCCSMEDQEEVLKNWESMWSAEYTGRRVTIAQEVYKILFKKSPATKDLFKRVKVDDINSPEFRAHCVRVTNGFDTMINLLFDPEALGEHLNHLSVQHKKYAGMRADYLRLFRESFAEVLPQAIPCFNSAAWNKCISNMQNKIGDGLAP